MVVIGIDSGKDKIDAVAIRDGAVIGWITITEGEDRPARGTSLARMQGKLQTWLAEMIWIDETHADEIRIFVEAAIMVRSVRVAIQLAHTVGMLLALPYLVYEVPIDQWKQIAIGKGGVSKSMVREVVTARLPDVEDTFGNRQDLYDAAGIALYGESVLQREIGPLRPL